MAIAVMVQRIGQTAFALEWPSDRIEIISVDPRSCTADSTLRSESERIPEARSPPSVDVREPSNHTRGLAQTHGCNRYIAHAESAGVAGGTGMYSTPCGRPSCPRPSETREAIRDEAETRGWQAMHHELTRSIPPRPDDPRTISKASRVVGAR